MSSSALHASWCEYISRFKLGTVIIMELEIIVVVRFVTFKYCTDMDKESLCCRRITLSLRVQILFRYLTINQSVYC